MKEAVLTIAGSDSSSGAGIQADIKTFSDFGLYAACAVTAVTSQDASSISDIHYVPLNSIACQIESAINRFRLRAVKTGMLCTKDRVEMVANILSSHNITHIVVDPVLISSTGSALLSHEGLSAAVDRLFPISMLVTPNIKEAEAICRFPIDSIEKMKEAAEYLFRQGAENVLITGGIFSGMAVDMFYDGNSYIRLSNEKLNNNIHGSGCMLSSAIAAGIAKGLPVIDAVKKARNYIFSALKRGTNVDAFKDCDERQDISFHSVRRLGEKKDVLEKLESAVRELKKYDAGCLIPEIQSNLVYALSDARDTSDVAAIPGRIIRLNNAVFTVRPPEFGSSRHMAKVVLSAMKVDKTKRAAMNIAYSKDILNRLEAIGLSIEYFDRKGEPRDIKNREGKTLIWGVESVVGRLGYVPDIIYDTGDIGKEPVIRIIAECPCQVVNIIKKLLE